MRSVDKWLRTSAKPRRAGIPLARQQAVSKTAFDTHQPSPVPSTRLADNPALLITME